jgi:phosphotransferase system HPr (HPr) family protein
MIETTVQISNDAGLHARPLAAFVKVAKRFESAIEVQNLTTGKGPMNGKSPVQLLLLTAQQGHTLRISADGQDAEAALAALVQLVEADFALEKVLNGTH